MAIIKNSRLEIEILVDDGNYDWLSRYTWGLDQDGYAITTERLPSGKQRKIKMHRIVANPPKGYMVDHINHDKLDNRLANLRVCTNSQNQWNSTSHKDARSKFKGVHKITHCNRWQARIAVNGKRMDLGTFYYEIEAAAAYNAASLKYHGEFANMNIFDEQEVEMLQNVKQANPNDLGSTEFRIMQFIMKFIKETATDPSPMEIGKGIGYKSSSAFYKYLDSLKLKGFITWHERKYRTVRPLREIPII